MISPVCTVNGEPTLDGVDVPPGEAVLIQLVSTAGVDVWTLQCIGTDETSDRDEVNANLVINTARKSASFTPSGPGKAFMFQSIANGKVAATFGVYTLATGNRVGAINETTEGSAKFGWLTKFNKFLRGTTSGGASVPSGSGFWHITNGIGDGAAKLVENSDIAPGAKIAASKVDFTFGISAPGEFQIVLGEENGIQVDNAGGNPDTTYIRSLYTSDLHIASPSNISFDAPACYLSGSGLFGAKGMTVGIAGPLFAGAKGGNLRLASQAASAAASIGGDVQIVAENGAAGRGRIVVSGEIRGNEADGDPLRLGLVTRAVTGGTVTLTAAEFCAQTIRLTGALTAAAVVVFPTVAGYAKLIRNDTTGNFALTVKTAAGLGVAIPPGQARWVFCDGTNLLSGGQSNGIVSMLTVATTTLTQTLSTTYIDVTGLLLTFPVVVPGDKVIIQSAARLSIASTGYSAQTVVAVVDGASTVTLPETERQRSQPDSEGYQHSVSIYTVANTGSLVVKQQLRSTSSTLSVFCNGGSSLVGTLIRP